ncbi:LamG-like jellyroll fold domain-containing protein [Streptomyces sp. NPDC093089]|uniref:LamG-like jellyroll fold domain-containing protein n=1 Tax=Streptomyces sp. NPDC093089 TaxID=3366024 RepID=UPI003829E4BA
MDGGLTWPASVPQPQLDDPAWFWVSTGPGHGIQLSRAGHHGRLVVPGDHRGGGKAGGQLYYSDDGGLTWRMGAVSETPDTGSYPAELTVAETVDGGLHVNARNSEITRCTTDEHRPAATSTDGGAQLGTRLSGKAREFDGQDDHLRLACSPTLRVDSPDKAGDFTVTAWFLPKAATGTLPIVWAYGMPGSEPPKKGRHFSVRAEPEAGVLRATVGTDIGSTEVTLPAVYDDDAWHHVVFTRKGPTLSLAMDGGTPATAVMPAGAKATDTVVTPNGQFNVHIGARPDFPNQPVGVGQLFHGTLDDVRLYGRALDPLEAGRVKDGSLDAAEADERLRLGFSAIR